VFVWQVREGNMLKISITETPTETRWVLQGRLFEPWVSDLSAIWRTSTRTRKGRTCIVDINDVTFVDKGAEQLLRAMSRQGAQFLANGFYIKHVLQGLKISGKRGLSGMITSFFAALLLSVIVSGASTRMSSEVAKMNAKHDARTRLNSSNAAPAPYAPAPLFKGKEDLDYASRLPRQNR
jgi:hypothetical protein